MAIKYSQNKIIKKPIDFWNNKVNRANKICMKFYMN